jgi:vesicle coat complex subunit
VRGRRVAAHCADRALSDVIPTIAPDVLRELAKDFRSEALPVKQQILNLAVKLYLSFPKQTALLFKCAARAASRGWRHPAHTLLRADTSWISANSISATTSAIVSLDALARWRRPS